MVIRFAGERRGPFGAEPPLNALYPFAERVGASAAEWKAACALYLQDRPEEALDLALRAGEDAGSEAMDFMAAMEAEAETRRAATLARPADWLEFEAVAAELEEPVERAAERAWAAAERIYARLLPPGRGTVRIALLARRSRPPAPWAEVGYAAAKEACTKLCVSPSAWSAGGLESAVAALAACHAAHRLAGGNAAPWLEAASMAVTGERVASGVRAGFCAGEWPWLSPATLSARLMGRTLQEDRLPPFHVARAQALLVGQHLLESIGEARLRGTLARLAPANPLRALWLMAQGDPTKVAVKAGYGYAPEKLFEDALASACG